MRHCRAGAMNRPPQFRSPPYQFGRVHHQGPDAKSDPDGLGNGEHGNQHSANLRSRVSPRYRDQTLSIPWRARREGAHPPNGRERSAGGGDASPAIDRVLQALVACLSSDHEAELAAASGHRGRDMCRASSDGSWGHHVALLAALPGFVLPRGSQFSAELVQPTMRGRADPPTLLEYLALHRRARRACARHQVAR